MLNYDHEADTYDVTRGGEARAAAAAAAATTLLPPGTALLADLACGTGIVTARLRLPGRKVIGIDLSPRMASIAATRLPGQIAVGDATTLPLADASVDAVVLIWLLQLMGEPDSAATLAQAARILRPGGVLITTVDKNDANFAIDSDIADLINPVRTAYVTPACDAADRVRGLAAQLDLTVTAKTTFTGKGQGRSPRQWCANLRGGDFAWAKHASELTRLCEQLRALPYQDEARPDPVYDLVKLTKGAKTLVRSGTPQSS